MDLMIGYFLPGILALGIITSYEDIIEGKIRNQWIIMGIVYSIIINASFIIFNLGRGFLNIHYLIELLTNAFFATIIGFGAWHLGYWTAGDGKLFIAFAALVPLSEYSREYIEWFPSAIILINTFLLGGLFMLGNAIYKAEGRDFSGKTKSFLKASFGLKDSTSSAITLIILYWIVESFISSISVSFIFHMAVIFLILYFIEKKIGRKTKYALLIIIILRFILNRSIYDINFLREYAILFLTWRILVGFMRVFVSGAGVNLFTRDVKAESLFPGMVLAQTIEKRKNMTKKEIREVSSDNFTEVIKAKGVYYILRPRYEKEAGIVNPPPEGLTKKDIKSLKRLGIPKFKISQTVPFAPLLFIGTLISLAVKGSIIILFM